MSHTELQKDKLKNGVTKGSGIIASIISGKHKEIFIVALIFFIALAIRIKFAWPGLIGTQGFLMGDDDDYYRLAISLLENGKFQDGNQLAYRMPVFPIFLAVIFKLFGKAPQNAIVFIVVISALICVGTYFLGKIIFGQIVGLAAGLITAFDMSLIFHSRFLLSDIIFVFIVLFSFLLLEKFWNSPNVLFAILLGIFWGLATLIRVNFGFFIPLALLYLLLISRSMNNNMFKYVGLIAFIVGSFWLIWIIRNYIVLGAFIPFTTAGGPTYHAIYNDISASQQGLTNFGFFVDFQPAPLFSDMNELEIDRAFKILVINWIKGNPLIAIRIAFAQVFHLWKPIWIPTVEIPYIIVLVASVVGVIVSIKKNIFQIRIWLLLTICLTFLALITIGTPRYRLVLHPLFAILASYGLVHINRVLLRKIRHR